jgi:hypothetical protein
MVRKKFPSSSYLDFHFVLSCLNYFLAWICGLFRSMHGYLTSTKIIAIKVQLITKCKTWWVQVVFCGFRTCNISLVGGNEQIVGVETWD